MTYSTFDVDVEGGRLRVGRWTPESPELRVVAIHGITAHHLSWPLVAEALPEAEILAPDLRGRGRSRDLPVGAGMVSHADDVAAVIRKAGGPVVVVGHSMGGFVAMVLAHRHPELVSGLVLVDGGFPFAPAEQKTTEAGLGLIKARLEAEFASPQAYIDLFRAHPAFVDDLSTTVDDYARYDVIGDPPHAHASAVVEAVLTDQRDLLSGEAHAAAIAALPGWTLPTVFLRAPRGFVDDPPGLYAAETVEDFRSRYPGVEFREVEGVNHYTITLGGRGAEVVAAAVRDVGSRATS